MCSSKSKLKQSSSMNGRAVLQPNCCNRAPLLERRNSFDIALLNTTSSSPTNTIGADYNNIAQVLNNSYTPPPSPTKPKSPTLGLLNIKRNVNHQPNPTPPPPKSKSKTPSTDRHQSSRELAPGSIAAARREQVAILQEQRKMRIAHYGRTTAAKSSPANNNNNAGAHVQQEKRCSFITPNSGSFFFLITYY